MKKVYSTIMMLAMMVAALSLASCGGDDDENDNGNGNGGGIDDSRDFIEVTVNGHKYSHTMFGIYAELPLDDGLILTSTTEDVFYEDGFSFFFSLAHYENSSKLLSSSLGSHSIRNSWYYDGATNLCFYPIYKVGKILKYFGKKYLLRKTRVPCSASQYPQPPATLAN